MSNQLQLPQSCVECHAHEELEEKFDDAMKEYRQSGATRSVEHAELKTTMHWIIKVGGSLIAFIAFAFHQNTNRFVETSESVIRIEAILSTVVERQAKYDEIFNITVGNTKHLKEDEKD